ncbi:glycosyltransferase family A protein [Emcibacter sp. SYSU 3D8]|uniref:glycosyltransferase family 2 protein n=1 Tax=Emcibacter sp. SYSU 3D8 TaxID=3133969 RepID=UPI0031FEC786
MPSAESISCVVPIYNGGLYLEEAVASIEAQSWGPVEIIVVDDGSTDDTPRMIAGLGTRIRAFRKENGGSASARNLGMAHASGSFFAFLDADDEWKPEKLAVQMARFEHRPELDLSLCGTEHWWIPELQHEAETHSSLLNDRQTGAFPTVLARRSLFERTGPLDDTLRHLDLVEWMLRVKDVGGVVETIPDTLVRRRIHHTNASRQRGDQEIQDRMVIARKRMQRRRPDGRG